MILDSIKKRLLKNEKSKEVAVNMLGGLVVKGLAMVLSLFSLPLHIAFFDNQTILGVWFTLMSVLTWVNMFDFGLTNGLRNSLVKPVEEKDKKTVGILFSSTASVLLIVAIISIAAIIPLSLNVDINSIFNVSVAIIDRSTLTITAIILFSGTMMSFVLKTVSSLIYSLQKSSINNFCGLCSSAIPLLLMVILKNFELSLTNKMVVMAIAHVLSSCIPLTVAYFIIKRKYAFLSDISFSFRNSDLATARSQIQVGLQFFIAQGAFLVITQTNEFLISFFFSPESVVHFRAYNSLFLIVGSVFQVALAPVWSSVTKACVQKDYDWLGKLAKVLSIVSVLAAIFEFLVVPFVPFIFKIWLGNNAVSYSVKTALIFATYGFLYITNIVVTTIANGLGKIKVQIVFYSIGAILKIPFIMLMKAVYPENWEAVIIANIVALGIFVVAQIMWFSKFYTKIKKDNTTNIIHGGQGNE